MMTTEAEAKVDIAALIERDRVHGRVYYDQAIYDREIREIWHKVWVYLGHESEVPAAGDYMRRQIGLHPVIMVRGSDNKIRVFFNRCRHRGNVLCHKERGNAREFNCQYHGWVYSTKGEFVAPTFGEAYSPALKAEDFSLSPVPRVDSYRGMLFGSLSTEGISLDAHLGEVKPYLDRIIDRSPVGRLQMSAGSLGTSYRGNWKMLPENSLEGGYHGQFIHKFAFSLAEQRDGQNRREIYGGRNSDERQEVFALPGGHMVQDYFRDTGPVNAALSPDQALYLRQLEAAYGPERARELTAGLCPMVYIFPNVMFLFTHFRRVQPVSVDFTHVYYYPTLLEGAPPSVNEKIVRNHEQSFTPGAFLVPDDLQICERNQTGILAGGNEWLFLGRGSHRERPLAHGGSSGHVMDENQLRGFWHHYAQLMNG
jgi:phenylpropionate dioxygenase-like ring-hydroxylating dioxygenase large terminal subunit